MIMDDPGQGDPECSYLEDGVDTAQEAGDHRRQMMQFCGQEHHCTLFNSERAMLTAMVRSPGQWSPRNN